MAGSQHDTFAEEVRRRIAERLEAEGALDAICLAERVGLPRSAIQSRLETLERHELIQRLPMVGGRRLPFRLTAEGQLALDLHRRSR